MLIRVAVFIALTATAVQAGTVEDAFRAVVEAHQADSGWSRAQASDNRGSAATRDKTAIMVSKDVGDERWSITWGEGGIKVTGVVYTATAAHFIDCRGVGIDERPGGDELILNCDAGTGVVYFDDWVRIATGLRLPVKFFAP